MSSSSPSSFSIWLSSARAQQDSTSERIAKYTVASSIAGAVFTAAYESTIGRARAVRELEAQSQARAQAQAGRVAATDTLGPQQPGNVNLRNTRPDVAKFYRHNTAVLSAAAALNSGLVAFAFFNLREYAVSPGLASARSSYSSGEPSGQDDGSEKPLTWSAMRTRHLVDTALTGALLGGAYNTWRKGPRGILSGTFTASLACTALQLVVNELDVQRVRYASRLSRHISSPTASSSQVQPSVFGSADRASAFNSSTSTSIDEAQTTEADNTDSGPSLGERMLSLIGIKKVDDDEYVRRLKAKRDRHLARIRELEALVAAKKEQELEADSDFVSDESGERTGKS